MGLSTLTTTSLLLTLLPSVTATYTLTTDYLASPEQFFTNFAFFTGADPTHGTVNYLNFNESLSAGLLAADPNYEVIYIASDSTNTGPRGSVRISSLDTFDTGLFMIDIFHHAGGACGTWPAIWLLGGGEWPAGGEIDIIEGVNGGATNQMTLHTSPGCAVQNSSSSSYEADDGYTGTLLQSSCASSGDDNNGCGITAPASPPTYGIPLNEALGGVFATEVTTQSISIWFFDRNNIPSDITANQPDPTGWGTPQALFAGCDVEQHFNNLSLIIDTTFCGDWAGNVWESSGCAASTGASSCEAYVEGSPGGFNMTYWVLGRAQVYQDGNATGGYTKVKREAGEEQTQVLPREAMALPVEFSVSMEGVKEPAASRKGHAKAHVGGHAARHRRQSGKSAKFRFAS